MWIEPDDTFSLDALAPGTYTLTAVVGDTTVATASGIQVAPLGTAEVVLRPMPGASVEIERLQDEAGDRAASTARFFVEVSSDGIPAGEDELHLHLSFLVPPGEVQVRIFHLEGAGPDQRRVTDVVEPLTLAAGQERRVEFRP